LVVPVLMVVVLIVVQCALWAHAAQVVQVAASTGDRTARSVGGGTAAGFRQAEAVTHGPGSDLTSSTVVITVLPGDVVRTEVTGTADSILPGFTLPVSSVEVGPLQEFRGTE
jgi:Flp pilus assembly protein TadG